MYALTKTTIRLAVAGLAAAAFMTTSAAQAEWKPKGPISVMIGFAAGGGWKNARAGK